MPSLSPLEEKLLAALKDAEWAEAQLIGEWADFWDVAPQLLIDALMTSQKTRNAAIAEAERVRADAGTEEQ